MTSLSVQRTRPPTRHPFAFSNPAVEALRLYYTEGDSSLLAQNGLMFLIGEDTARSNEAAPEQPAKKKRRKKNSFNFDEGKVIGFDYYSTRRKLFREVFRMEFGCFKKMYSLFVQRTTKFDRKADAVGQAGIHPEVKLLACLNVLTSGNSLVQVANLFKIARPTLNYCFDTFLEVLPKALESYVTWPNNEEAAAVVLKHEARHKLPGCLGSLDCLHWAWGQCRMDDAYAFSGKSGKPSVVLEAVADCDLKFLFYNFGSPGCQNDITIIRSSPLLTKISQGRWPKVPFS